ncbi:MAG: DNA integrity scanning diadenylate cyclase DisA [Acidimicrobiales bacterium]
MDVRPSSAMADVLALVAPGQPLRDGLERVLQANRGALVVVGDDHNVLSICTGGFLLDAEFSPQRLSELAKMDGAIILSTSADRIARANVHLMPDASIPTIETGTRHRTAERVARSIDVPVVSVSAAMGLVTVYHHDVRHVLQPERRLHERVSQALQTLQRFRQRFDLALTALSAMEIADTVTVRDVVAVLQPAELLCRIAEEVKADLVELGEDGRLLRLQLEEVIEGIDPVRRLIVRDYIRPDAAGAARAEGRGETRRAARAEGRGELRRVARADGLVVADGAGPATAHALEAMTRLSTDEVLDVRRMSGVLGLGAAHVDPDGPLEPRGYRLLHRLPRFPEVLADRIVEHFAGLQRIMRASVGELEEVGGVGEARARSVKDGLSHLAETSILDRYS